MNEENLISVIIPIYNAEKNLKECLDSVLEQTYRNLEIILVNDGSKDSSGEICKRYWEKDPRVVLIEQENAGVAVARNRGISAATGDYVLFVDSDDVIEKNICEIAMRSIKDFDILIFDIKRFCEPKEIKRIWIPIEICTSAIQQYSGGECLRRILSPERTNSEGSNLCSACAKFYRRGFLENFQISCPAGISIGEDMLFNVQVYMHEPKICYLPVKGYFYRTNPTSAVHRYNPRFRESDRKFYEELKIILDRKQLWETFREGINYQRVNGMLMTFSNDIFHPDNPKSERQKKVDFLELVGGNVYQSLIPQQMKYYGTGKRLLLACAKGKCYYPLKAMYMLKGKIRKSG